MALVKYNNNSISDVTELAGVPSGAIVHIKTLTASSSSTISFIDGSSSVVFDNTYPVYFIKFISVHPGTNDQPLTFQGTTDGSNFNTTITSTHFEALVRENNSSPSVNYQSSQDLSQSTDFQYIQKDFGNDDDQNGSGTLFIFNPSSTTFVKHFVCRSVGYVYEDYVKDYFAAGYLNTTSAIDAIQFKMSSGEIQGGTIDLFGVV